MSHKEKCQRCGATTYDGRHKSVPGRRQKQSQAGLLQLLPGMPARVRTGHLRGRTMSNTITDLPQYTAGHRPDWSLIPGYMTGGLRRYIENGIAPGSFLSAVLRNDLQEAVSCADDTNRYILHNYIKFLYNYAPPDCYGSEHAYSRWVEKGGLGWHLQGHKED